MPPPIRHVAPPQLPLPTREAELYQQQKRYVQPSTPTKRQYTNDFEPTNQSIQNLAHPIT